MKKTVTVTFTYEPSSNYPEEATEEYLKDRLQRGLYIRRLQVKNLGIHKERGE